MYLRSIAVLAMERDLVLSGWTMLTVLGLRLGLMTVGIMPGDLTTAIIMKMSLSAAIPPMVGNLLFLSKTLTENVNIFKTRTLYVSRNVMNWRLICLKASYTIFLKMHNHSYCEQRKDSWHDQKRNAILDITNKSKIVSFNMICHWF